MIDITTVRPEYQAQYRRLRLQWLRFLDMESDATSTALASSMYGDWDRVTAATAIETAAWWALRNFECEPLNFIDCPYRSGLEQADIGLRLHEDLGELYR